MQALITEGRNLVLSAYRSVDVLGVKSFLFHLLSILSGNILPTLAYLCYYILFLSSSYTSNSTIGGHVAYILQWLELHLTNLGKVKHQ